MRAFQVVLASAGCAVLLAACSSASSGGGSGDTSSSSSSSTSSAPSSASPSSSAQGVATDLNPCKLVTQSEASKLAGTRFGPGKEAAVGTGKNCTYGGQTTNVFTVEVAQAADAATAQADWDAEQAKAQDALKQLAPQGLTVNLDTASLSGLGDRAAFARASASFSGVKIAISGIYVLKGATFFAFQDLALNKAAPSESDLKAEAQTVLGRI